MKTNKNIKFKLLFVLLIVLPLANAVAADYYISALTGSDVNNGLTSSTAFKTIQKAADLTNPGDTVFIMDGTYSEVKTLYSIHKTVLYITRSGSETGGFITYKNYPGHTPKISGENCIWNCVLIRANYIRFEGIELEGPNQSITYEEARAMYDYYVTGENLDWYLIGTMNTNGLSLGGNMGTGPKSIYHHIEVRNCIVHDFQGGGIGGSDFDYITIENNTIYNNSWYGMYATSGISVFHSHDIDNNTSDYKNIIRGNICYNNKTLIPWAGRDYLSDGNGIIIDDNRNKQLTGENPYTGKTLVENNISYNNGGSGIHAYSSNNVDIINNTAWNNGLEVGYPEIYGQDGENVKIYNNIMYARTGGACNSNAGGTTYDFNIYFNGPASRMGANDVVADPKFVKLALDGTADFQVRSNSPAINAGSDTPGQYSSVDIEGVERPIGVKPDIGAYESEFLEMGFIPEITVRQGTGIQIANSGSFSFGDVFYDSPKTVIFTIENTGKSDLKIKDSPVIKVSGNGFSLLSDADTLIAPNNTTTFAVKLTTSSDTAYTATINIESNDSYDNPFIFSLTGNGKNPAKATQKITFNALPVKNIEDDDFSPGAIASTGLPIFYESSDTTVATIANGLIHIAGLGTTLITASQPGNENTHPADDVQQSLTVTEVLYRAGTNLISNPNFNSNTTGWSFAYQNSGAAMAASAEKEGYSSKTGQLTITSNGTTTSAYNVQFGSNVSVKQGKSYIIMFKASAETDRPISLMLIQNSSPWGIPWSKSGVNLTTVPATFGPFIFDCAISQTLVFRFLVGNSASTVYIDDVEIYEAGTPTAVMEDLEYSKDSDFKVYPNPLFNKLNVVTSSFQGQHVEISLLNLEGKKLISRLYKSTENGLNNFSLEVNVNPGIYLVLLSTDKKREVKTIVVQ